MNDCKSFFETDTLFKRNDLTLEINAEKKHSHYE